MTSPEEVQALAEAWFNQQMRRAEARHGAQWPENREWVADYLREEVQQRTARRMEGQTP